MTADSRELARQYKEQRAAMQQKVSQMPLMNVRPKDEWDRIEEARQDPKEAQDKMAKHMQDLARSFREEKAAMAQRVAGNPKRMTFWTKQEWNKIEDLRQDPDEARERAETLTRSRMQAWQKEKAAMMERVDGNPAMSFWTPQERADIEEARQDPDEALERMTRHMRGLGSSWKEWRGSMTARVQQSPRMTFWTKEAWDKIEDVRQDPEEARERTAKEMRELARTYQKEKREIQSRVAALPKKTFMLPEERARRRRVEELRNMRSGSASAR